MPDVAAADRISKLKQARDAAQAVADRMIQLDNEDPVPSHMQQRLPKRLQAQGDVDDLSDVIDDEEAAAKVVTIDDASVADLQTLAARLDKASVTAALVSGGLATATTVLNDVAKVRGVLNA